MYVKLLVFISRVLEETAQLGFVVIVETMNTVIIEKYRFLQKILEQQSDFLARLRHIYQSSFYYITFFIVTHQNETRFYVMQEMQLLEALTQKVASELHQYFMEFQDLISLSGCWVSMTIDLVDQVTTDSWKLSWKLSFAPLYEDYIKQLFHPFRCQQPVAAEQIKGTDTKPFLNNLISYRRETFSIVDTF